MRERRQCRGQSPSAGGPILSPAPSADCLFLGCLSSSFYPPCLLPRVPILLPPPLPWLLQVPVPLMRFRTLRQSFSIDVCPLLVLSPSISPSAIDLRVCDLKLELTASRVRGRAREGVMCDISGLHCAMQSGCEGAARDPSGLWGS